LAARVDGKIQSSAGPETPHQAATRLDGLHALTNDFAVSKLTELGFEVSGDPNYVPTEEEEAEEDRIVEECLRRLRSNPQLEFDLAA
jgi:hypothetical protein